MQIFFDKDENKVFSRSVEGKTILVSFGLPWCGHCVEELPSLDILQKILQEVF